VVDEDGVHQLRVALKKVADAEEYWRIKQAFAEQNTFDVEDESE
jgi:hypothetical protein